MKKPQSGRFEKVGLLGVEVNPNPEKNGLRTQTPDPSKALGFFAAWRIGCMGLTTLKYIFTTLNVQPYSKDPLGCKERGFRIIVL